MRKLWLLVIISVFLGAIFANAARNPMGYWYEWKDSVEHNHAIKSIELGWENQTSVWKITVVLDSGAIKEERLLLFNTHITLDMCRKAQFPMILEISTSDGKNSWRGLCDAGGDGFSADETASITDEIVAIVFSDDSETYLIWLPYGD